MGSNIDLSAQVNCLNLLYALFSLPVYFLFRPDGSPEYYRVTPVLCSYDNHNSNKMIVHHLSIASKEITPISLENSDEGEAPFTQLLQLINHGAGVRCWRPWHQAISDLQTSLGKETLLSEITTSGIYGLKPEQFDCSPSLFLHHTHKQTHSRKTHTKREIKRYVNKSCLPKVLAMRHI